MRPNMTFVPTKSNEQQAIEILQKFLAAWQSIEQRMIANCATIVSTAVSSGSGANTRIVGRSRKSVARAKWSSCQFRLNEVAAKRPRRCGTLMAHNNRAIVAAKDFAPRHHRCGYQEGVPDLGHAELDRDTPRKHPSPRQGVQDVQTNVICPSTTNRMPHATGEISVCVKIAATIPFARHAHMLSFRFPFAPHRLSQARLGMQADKDMQTALGHLPRSSATKQQQNSRHPRDHSEQSTSHLHFSSRKGCRYLSGFAQRVGGCGGFSGDWRDDDLVGISHGARTICEDLQYWCPWSATRAAWTVTSRSRRRPPPIRRLPRMVSLSPLPCTRPVRAAVCSPVIRRNSGIG